MAAGSVQSSEADITGRWQGVLKVGTSELRTVLKVTKGSDGQLRCEVFNIDQGADALDCSAVSIRARKVSIALADLGASYEGTLSTDGRNIAGQWNQEASWPLDLVRATPKSAWNIDPAPHKVRFVTTSDGVRLEVLDWGGEGAPLLLIAGLGVSGHVFDTFAPRLTARHHVYALTRRGFGASDRPDPAKFDYSSDRLGNDVLDVIKALKVTRPVLAGWSLGGEEMSSIASRHPDAVSALIYMDAGYAYSFYAPGNTFPIGANVNIAASELNEKFRALNAPGLPAGRAIALIEALRADISDLQVDLLAMETALQTPSGPSGPLGKTAGAAIWAAITAGERKYTRLNVPMLAIFAIGSPDAGASPLEQVEAMKKATIKQEQIKRFQAGNASARVVQIEHAQHAVFASNPDEVLREIDDFLDHLAKEEGSPPK
jgi:non-heme chloroperoxidase